MFLEAYSSRWGMRYKNVICLILLVYLNVKQLAVCTFIKFSHSSLFYSPIHSACVLCLSTFCVFVKTPFNLNWLKNSVVIFSRSQLRLQSLARFTTTSRFFFSRKILTYLNSIESSLFLLVCIGLCLLNLFYLKPCFCLLSYYDWI